MKHQVFLSIAGALAIPFLASCGGGSGKTTLDIGFWPESTETQDLAMYRQWKERFESDYPQYELVADPYTYNTTTVGSKFLTGSLPNVFQTWFTEPEKLMKNKYIRGIKSFLDKRGWTTKMDDEMKAALTFDDEIYGIPRDGYGLGLLLNIRCLGENGILPQNSNGKYSLYQTDGTPAYPTSFEEIYQDAIKIQKNDETKGILICSANKNGGWQLSNMAWNFGGALESKNTSGKWEAHLDCQANQNALKWIQKMKSEDLLLNSTTVYYDDWYSSIGSKVAMAFVGSDVLQLASVNGGVSMGDLAFIPMPTGDGNHHYSLYGGTPYVFSANASDDQIEGILKFFEYIGRGPDVTDIAKEAMVEGYKTAAQKNQPILPKIKPWKNEDFLTYANSLEKEYISVDMSYYNDFFDHIAENKHSEEPYCTQELYEYLDTAIQNVLQYSDTANVASLLTTANGKLQTLLDQSVNQ